MSPTAHHRSDPGLPAAVVIPPTRAEVSGRGRHAGTCPPDEPPPPARDTFAATDSEAADLPAPPPRAHRWPFVGPRSAAPARRQVLLRARLAGMEPVRAEELVVAVNELVTNSLVHGGGAGVLSIWLEDGRLVCDVHDWGDGDDRLAGCRTAGPPWHPGHGLCIVDELCDLVQLRSSPAGATARVGVAVR